MNIEHPEYNSDTNPYPSFGKKYNGEKAIISLTSWKARINTVSKTLFSLLQQCPRISYCIGIERRRISENDG
jgi:hypothetical protein